MKRLHSIIATTAAASLFLILFAPPATAQLDKFNYRLIPSTELTASASDTSYPAYPPANAVDGNVNSCARINDAPPGQWFQLDAGHIRMLAGMEIYSSNYRIQDYEIYVSDEADPIDWGTPVASGTLPNTTAWHPITFAPAYGRYLRLAVLSRYSAVTTYIYEVRLYESQFQLASLVTGHTGYANSNMVAIAAMPAMTGYDAYQITGSVAEPVSGWLAYDPDNPPIGVEVSLGTPAEGEAVTRYAWFKDEGNGVKPTTNAPATITFVRDSADVTASALASFSVPSWGNAAPADIRTAHVDNGSHSAIGLHSVTISVPEDLLPDNPTRVKLSDTGSYTLTLTATDNAGNIDTTTCALTVFAGDSDLTTVWTGAGDGSDWHDNANWNNYAPAPAGLAFITNSATVALKEDSAALASIVVSNNATITFSNWNTTLSADSMKIGNKGTITSAGPIRNGEMSNNVVIVCETFELANNGKIDLAGKGYAGATRSESIGHGPGGSGSTGNNGGGGGHGGKGGEGGFFTNLGSYTSASPGGPTYGVAAAPIYLGSGGGSSTSYDGHFGGDGGGALKLTVSGNCRIMGEIRADGKFYSSRGGCGSGGSVFITCGIFSGTGGTITADGPNGTNQSGGGGGGRIAIIVTDSAAQADIAKPLTVFSARGGASANYADAKPGTLYLSNLNLIDETCYRHSGHLIIPNFSSWQPTSLNIENAMVQFSTNAFDLAVDGDLQISGSTATLFTHQGSTITVNGTLSVTNGATLHLPANPDGLGTVSVAGDLLLSADASGVKGSTIWIECLATNQPPDDTSLLVNVGGSIVIGTNSAIEVFSHPTTGGSALFKCYNFTVAAGGIVNADGGGFNNVNKGPGLGRTNNSQWGGGGYGGLGGYASVVNNSGLTYGSRETPLLPGSSGQPRFTYYNLGNKPLQRSTAFINGYGGGLIRIAAANRATINGTLTANGGNCTRGGAGSGGGIYIHCRRFAGGTSALIRADGGAYTDAGARDLAGGGGGGRIAIWRSAHYYQGSYSVLGGTSTKIEPEAPGAPGTVFLGDLPQPGTIMMLR